MSDYSVLYAFVDGGNTVHCKNNKEVDDLLDILSDLGVKIGFPRNSWRDARYFSLGTKPENKNELHACIGHKFRHDGVQCEFSVLMERAEAADAIPEIDELPPLTDLIGVYSISVGIES